MSLSSSGSPEDLPLSSDFLPVVSIGFDPLSSSSIQPLNDLALSLGCLLCITHPPPWIISVTVRLLHTIYTLMAPKGVFATPWIVANQASSVRGVLQARILEWVAIPFSQPRDKTWISWIAGRLFTLWGIREADLTCIAPHSVNIELLTAHDIQGINQGLRIWWWAEKSLCFHEAYLLVKKQAINTIKK